MKFCYLDETGTGSEPIAIIIGILVDAYRMKPTKKDWDEKFIPETRIADLQNSSGKRFFNPKNIDFSPPTDFFLCTMINRFDFVLKATRRFDGNIDLMKIES